MCLRAFANSLLIYWLLGRAFTEGAVTGAGLGTGCTAEIQKDHIVARGRAEQFRRKNNSGHIRTFLFDAPDLDTATAARKVHFDMWMDQEWLNRSRF